MAVNTYEGMFLLDSNRYSREPTAVSGQIADMVRKHEGEVLASRLWEERRLAYPVEGHRKGSYWLTYFKLDSQHLARIQRDCQLSDTILRAMILKIDPRIADALVSHAKAGPAEAAKAKPPAVPAPAAPIAAVAEVEELPDALEE